MFTKVDGRQERDKSYGKCQSIFMNIHEELYESGKE